MNLSPSSQQINTDSPEYVLVDQHFPYCTIESGAPVPLHTRLRCELNNGQACLGIVIAISGTRALVVRSGSADSFVIRIVREPTPDFAAPGFKVLSTDAWQSSTDACRLYADLKVRSPDYSPGDIGWILQYKESPEALSFTKIMKGNDRFHSKRVVAYRPFSIWKPGVYLLQVQMYAKPLHHLGAYQERVILLDSPSSELIFAQVGTDKPPIAL